jgi:ribosomal-protein-alanine N-acetyltransferase
MMRKEKKKQKSLSNLYGLSEEIFNQALKEIEPNFPIKEIDSVDLLPLSAEHYSPWATMRAYSPEVFQEYEPEWSDDELSPEAFVTKLQQTNSYPSWHYAIEIFTKENVRLLAGGLSVVLPRGGTEKAIRISYWVAQPFQQLGIGSAAIEKLADSVFKAGFYRRIEALVCPENIPSQRILEKNGFEREGLLKEVLNINGLWRDHYLYTLLDKKVDKIPDSDQDIVEVHAS